MEFRIGRVDISIPEIQVPSKVLGKILITIGLASGLFGGTGLITDLNPPNEAAALRRAENDCSLNVQNLKHGLNPVKDVDEYMKGCVEAKMQEYQRLANSEDKPLHEAMVGGSLLLISGGAGLFFVGRRKS